MNWQSIISNHRKTIIINLTIAVLLFISLIVLLIVGVLLNTGRSTLSEEPTTEAAISEFNLSEYSTVLHGIIKEKYQGIIDNYVISKGELLEDGTWYITTIKKPTDNQWSLATDTYRIIMHKENDDWKIIAEPQLVFSYIDYPDIPRAIINSANNL